MQKSKMSVVACVLWVAACGMKINVNGKTRVIGGGGESAPPAAPAETTAAAPASPASAAPASPSRAAVRAQTIVLADAVTSAPIVVDVASVTVDHSLGKRFGGAYSPCGNAITRQPIAVLDVKVAQPNARVALTGASGVVLARGDRYWASCDPIQPKGGLEVGTYEVYPLARTYYDKPVEMQNLSVGISDPTKTAVWSDRAKKVAIAGKLAEPLFVEVTMSADRRARGEDLHGSRCARAAFHVEPDLVLELARPVKGLRVRAAGTVQSTTLRIQRPARSAEAVVPPPFCVDPNTPLGFGNSDEGTFGISVGLPRVTGGERVTLMIFDESTKLDPLRIVPVPGPLEVEHRSLALHFPFLTSDHLALNSYARAQIAAKVFETAPAEAFVFAKLDLDKDIAWNASYGAAFPHKNEPLLVTQWGAERSRVLAQDGFMYEMRTSHLLVAPDGEAAPLAAPRPLPDAYDRVPVEALLPPGNEKLAASLHAIQTAYENCAYRVAAPYNRQLPTITRPANVDIIVVTSPRARAIEDARDRAVDRACGTSQALEKKKHAQYRVLLERVEAGRKALFQSARRTFSRAS